MRRCVSLALLAVVWILATTGAHAGANYIDNWFDGSQGYEVAKQRQSANGGPMLVYFRTDWCGYCKKLDKGLLDKHETRDQLRPIPKVEINPESSKANARLASHFGVRGYPSMYVVKANGEFTKITGYKQSGGQWVIMSPLEFRQRIEQVGGPFPSSRRHGAGAATAKQTSTSQKSSQPSAYEALQKAGKHDAAVKLLNAEIKKNPSDANLYYARGVSEKELHQYTQARRDLEVAIALADDHYQARYALTHIYLELQMWSDARDSLNDLIDKKPSGRAYYLRGIANERSGSKVQARDDYSTACNLGEKKACNRL